MVTQTSPTPALVNTTDLADIEAVEVCNVHQANKLLDAGAKLLYICNEQWFHAVEGHPSGGVLRKAVKFVVGKPIGVDLNLKPDLPADKEKSAERP